MAGRKSKRRAESGEIVPGSAHERTFAATGRFAQIHSGDEPFLPTDGRTKAKSKKFPTGFAFKQDIARQRNLLDGPRDKRVSVRVEGALLDAAKAATGAESDTEIVRLALAVVAVPDDFGEWLLIQQGRLDADFDVDV